MASLKMPNIDGIDNIITMAQTMSTLGISAQGLTTLDEMKAEVKEKLNDSQQKANWTAGKAFSVLAETKDEDAKKRGKLLELYINTEECLKTIDDRLVRLLDTNFATDVKKVVENKKERLQIKEYVVLVAGETSSGKSSLINLILGEELLPSALLSTTSTICELRYGTEKKIIVHYKKPELEPKEILLKPPENGQSYIDQLSPYLHMKDDRERGSPFKKTELFWPHKVLEKGIVIVDSPGIGESEIMDTIVTDYLPEAFCFIYVINSANAGGVQKDRIEKLLEDARKISLEREQSFPCECALFVCNKWDTVPKDEADDVKKHVIKKLERCWPNLNSKSQIIYLSTTDATASQLLGAISPDFEILINAIKSMVQRSIDARIQDYWRWLDYLLSRMIYHTKAFIHNASKDRQEIKRKVVFVAACMGQIESEQHLMIKNLEEELAAKTNETVRKLSKYLTSKKFQSSFTSWTDDDAPKAQETWIATENDIMKAVKQRFRDEMKQWEIDNHVFEDARKSLLQRFSDELSSVQSQLQNVENSIISDSPLEQPSLMKCESFTTGQKILIGVTSPIWVPFGLIALVLSIPVLGVLGVKNVVEEKSKFRSYVKNRSGYLALRAKEYLTDVSKEDVLHSYVKEQLKEVELFLEKKKAQIPAIIDANNFLLAQLLVENHTKKEAEKFYLPINANSMAIRGKLSFFAIKDARSVDISCDELDWKEGDNSCLGRGGFATVYKAIMKRTGLKEEPVAVKVFHDLLNTENAYQLLSEEEILRKLKHPNVVKFYGTALLDQENGTRMIFVMELCTGNLKDFLEKHPERCSPGKAPSHLVEATKTTIQWAISISLALDFIHKQGIVHRDLKTENILIAKDNSVRIADVGVSKKVEDVTGTITGTPIYIAPEVFASEIYDWRADIYSFGLVLWEIWYGETVFSELRGVTCKDFIKMIRNGYRPTLIQGRVPPPPVWEELMAKCWKTNPESRISARECKEDLTECLKHLK